MHRVAWARGHRSRRWWPSALAGGLAIGLLSGCAGQAGQAGGSSGGGAGEGVEVGATAEEYQAALEGMEPVTLTYQVGAQSPEAITAWRSLELQKAVDELSGGKITIDLQYAQAIAPYPEVDSALSDGRIDIAYMLPVYEPSEYPVSSAFVAASTLAGNSPLVQELTANAAMTDVAWNTPELIEEFESQGLTVLQPVSLNGPVFAFCNEGGSDMENWHGRQTRVSSTVQREQVESFDATPVSLEHAETFEALQRNTIACTMSSAMPAVDQGFIDVSAHISYSENSSFARGPGALVAGSKFQTLPLAAQQLIFDQMGEYFSDSRRSDLAGNAAAAKAVRDLGGDFATIDTAADEALAAASEEAVQSFVDDGVVSDTFVDDVRSALDRWGSIVEELGYEDGGGFDDFDQWYEDGSVDFTPLRDRMDEEIRQAHRPS